MSDTHNRKLRLHWRCRRGIRELDLLFQHFLEQDFDRLDGQHQLVFEQLLDEADLDIYAWVTGNSKPENRDYLPIIRALGEIRAS